MQSDPPVQTLESRLSVVRIAAVLVILTTLALIYNRVGNRSVLTACENGFHEPEAALEACDVYLASMAIQGDANVALIHRHRMRAYMNLGDAAAAENEADLAIAAAPTVDTSWQWKSLLLAQMGDYPRAMEAIEGALAIVPDANYSLEMKGKLLHRMESPDAINDYYAQLTNAYPERIWIPKAWGAFQIGQQDYRAAALSYGRALGLNLLDEHSRTRFFESCRKAGGSCPILFPDLDVSSTGLSCGEVFTEFDVLYPGWGANRIDGTEFTDVQGYFYATPPLLSGVSRLYWRTLRDIETSTSAVDAEKFITMKRVRQCIQDKQVGRLKGNLESSIETELEQQYPVAVLDNLHRWAAARLAQQPASLPLPDWLVRLVNRQH